MRRISLVCAVVVGGGLAACKTGDSASGLRDGEDGATNTTLYADIRAALEEAGCDGCHAELADADLNQWASDTKNTFERLTSEEPPVEERGPGADFNPSTFSIKGAYKAYPEYFKVYFADDAVFKTFAAGVRPAPGMKVRGTGDMQKGRFMQVRDLLLQLAEQLGNQTSLGCTTKVSDDLKAHIQAMGASGWGAKLLSGDLRMFGCPSDTVDATQCMTDDRVFKPRADLASSAAPPGTRMLEVAAIGNTSYWMRSSPDGRFVGNGGPAHIDDLETRTRFVIASKSYDPGFFPDNSGWTFHGGGGVVFCANSTLKADAQEALAAEVIAGASWKKVKLDPAAERNAPYCLNSSGPAYYISTYQSVAAAQGSVAYVVTGSHSTDPGSIRPDDVDFQGDLNVYELRNAGGTYEYSPDGPRQFKLPNEGDYSLTPSGTYLVGRVAGDNGNGDSVQLGIRLRSLKNMLSQGEAFDAGSDASMSSVCIKGSGSKPMLSLDERFAVYHEYADDKSDLVLIDLLDDGKVYRITDVPAGHRALFPHFVANNMIYFLLHKQGGGEGVVVATDAAARITSREPAAVQGAAVPSAGHRFFVGQGDGAGYSGAPHLRRQGDGQEEKNSPQTR